MITTTNNNTITDITILYQMRVEVSPDIWGDVEGVINGQLDWLIMYTVVGGDISLIYIVPLMFNMAYTSISRLSLVRINWYDTGSENGEDMLWYDVVFPCLYWST